MILQRFYNVLLLGLLYSPLISHAESIANQVPTPPTLSARNFILLDFHSDTILMEKGTNERIDPASLTKLMTAYIVFEALKAGRVKLTDEVPISEKAWKMAGSRMYVEVNSRVPLELLIKGMIIQSGNDASVALAEYVSSSEETFVDLMNRKAQALALTNTHYANTTGLPTENHYSTTRDLAYMAKYLIRDFPEYYKYYSEKEFAYNNITQTNRNLLLWRDPTVDGVKTGYTETAGYCLIASAKRGDMRLIGVVMGTAGRTERADENQKMLEYGFRFFETYQLYKAQQTLRNERVWQGEASQIALGLANPLYITIPKGQYAQLGAAIQLNSKIVAPVTAGTTYGRLTVRLANQVITERPIIALTTVATGNWFQQSVDYLWSLW
ncbi:serine-type D-Ala-D-Ala carboxypeptidase [Beggiatoa leptomitoformis]|uniref:serine-type D-Ala-D-Ala carboxypeptidase n=2 Tax=Beggiatoa leptomitoformis TaxID=288004 RepID=A0A2N9YJA6_9GAMM|nr:serine-type D-Ala-D-Ala carboxypeptidase [Beggiatoa leptomitoformis]AUI70611.1 serine-type D-Ala-D-Ala carboxypeptidase [Beggiatoa leptomitoformis]